MNLDSIGIVAEVIGAFAVVVSLLYVATQIKQSNRQGASESGFALVAELNRFLELILAEPEVANLLAKLKSGEALTPQEEIRAEALAERLINNWWSAEMSHRSGIMDRDTYDDIVDEAKRWLGNYPALRRYFQEVLKHYRVAANMSVFAPIFEND